MIGMVTELSEDEAASYILELLKKRGKMTTQMVDEETQSRELQCPEGTIRTLNKLRVKGLIQGTVSQEHHGWVWWVGEATGD